MADSLAVADPLQVAATLYSSTDYTPIVAAAIGAAGLIFSVIYTQIQAAKNLKKSQEKQLETLLASQRNERMLDRELEAVENAYSTVYYLHAFRMTLEHSRFMEEATAYQMNIRTDRLYLDEEFVRLWRDTYMSIERLDTLETMIQQRGESLTQAVRERRRLRDQDIPEGLRECRRILLISQGRPTDEVDIKAPNHQSRDDLSST